MNPKVVLITGANRGIGLELVRQIVQLAEPPKIIFATCRNPEKAEELKNLKTAKTEIKIIKLDLSKLEELDNARKEVEASLGPEEGINLLINNAGIFKFETIDTITEESLRDHLQVNSIAPVMVIKTFLPLLRKNSSQGTGDSMSCSVAAVINMTSGSGSFDRAINGAFVSFINQYSYRMSKAALNMFTANLAYELKGEKILVSCFNPGWVPTDMGLSAVPEAKRDQTPEDLGMVGLKDSVSGMIRTMESLTEKDTGSFRNYNGDVIPW